MNISRRKLFLASASSAFLGYLGMSREAMAKQPAIENHHSLSVRWSGEIKLSDQRLKKNIKSYNNALEKALKLRTVSYQWNDTADELKTKHIQQTFRSESNTPEDNAALWKEEEDKVLKLHEGTRIGLIAQEVEEIFPEWVEEGENGYKSIRDELPAVLLAALKELKQEKDNEIKELKERLQALEKKIA